MVHHSFFDMPIRHEQRVALLQGKTINIMFEEVPLFIIQCILMIQASQSEQKNDDKIDANGQITILIALMTSLLGFLLNIITFIANAFNTYEEQMQVQNVLVKNPKSPLILHTGQIASDFSDDLFKYKVFAWKVRGKIYQLQFFHGFTDPEELHHRIQGCLSRYKGSETTIETIANPEVVQFIDHLVGMSRILGERQGVFEMMDGMLRLNLPISNMKFFTELVLQMECLVSQTFESNKKYDISDLKIHQHGGLRLRWGTSDGGSSRARHESLLQAATAKRMSLYSGMVSPRTTPGIPGKRDPAQGEGGNEIPNRTPSYTEELSSKDNFDYLPEPGNSSAGMETLDQVEGEQSSTTFQPNL